MHAPLTRIMAFGITGLVAAACGRAPAVPSQVGAAAAAAEDREDASEDDLPPLGRSLFDELVAVPNGDSYTQTVAFPFTSLVAQIAARVQAAPIQALFPGGRSLQRNAAGDQKYALPRVVLAVTSDSAASAQADLLLRDRLYIGYSEAAQQMEVISYNDEAGRFEFQVVDHYGAGLEPRLRYAPRSFCQACHQNKAPLFSAAPWAETNANPRISQLMQQAMGGANAYLGVPLAVLSNVPYAIDTATKNANYLAAYQRLWRTGCGISTAERQRCHLLAWRLALGYRQSGSFDPESSPYQEFSQLAGAAWTANLAAGVDLPSSVLNNFDPLTEALPGASPIPADREPLTARTTPLEQWSLAAGDHARLIYALADLISDGDLLQLQQTFGNGLEALDWRRLAAAPSLAASAYSRCSLLRDLWRDHGLAPHCEVTAAALPAPQLSRLGSPVAAADAELASFNTYCGACHSSGGLAFLSGSSAAEVKQHLGQEAAAHIARLDWDGGTTRPMPPPSAREHKALAASPQDRQRLIKLLQSWQTH